MNNKLSLILTPVLETLGFELVGCQLQSIGRQGQLLRILVDRLDREAGGVTIDDCARASHQIKGILEVENCIEGNYRLEVSSAGLERPLYTMAHYQRFLGSCVKIRMHEDKEGRRHFAGQIIAVDNEQVSLLIDGGTIVLPISEIDRANLVFEN